MERNDRLKLFANEIGDIKDTKLKTLATELIANADDYFFTVAASSSGKYHPQFDLGVGGLVRHTRCVAFFAKSLAESYCFSDNDKDALIVAAIAHDIKKQGDGKGSHTVWEHPTLASNYIFDIVESNKIDVPKKTVKMIANAVHSHMGKWGNYPEFTKGNEPLPMPSNEFEKALQAADYMASRKELLGFDFRPTEKVEMQVIEEQINKNYETLSLVELESYEMPFGKHKGKTLKEIKHSGNGYLDWIVNAVDFNNKDTQNIVKAYFNKLRESVTSDGREKVKEENKEYLTEKVALTSNEIDDLPF